MKIWGHQACITTFGIENMVFLALRMQTYPPTQKNTGFARGSMRKLRLNHSCAEVLMLRRISPLADNPPKPWRRRVFDGGTVGFGHGAPFSMPIDPRLSYFSGPVDRLPIISMGQSQIISEVCIEKQNGICYE